MYIVPWDVFFRTLNIAEFKVRLILSDNLNTGGCFGLTAGVFFVALWMVVMW